VHRIQEWGGRSDAENIDLVGYSARCLFEADLMLEYYKKFQGQELYNLMQAETDRDDFDILEGVISFLETPTAETQDLFDDYTRRKNAKFPRTPPYLKLAEQTGVKKEYERFYKFYSKYTHPSAYQLMGDHRVVTSGIVVMVFLDRAVVYAHHCCDVMNYFLSKTRDVSQKRASNCDNTQ